MPRNRIRNDRSWRADARQGSIARGSTESGSFGNEPPLAHPCWPVSGTTLGHCAARFFRIELDQDYIPSVVRGPDVYECPITLNGLCDAVVTCDGQVFEKAAIETWLQSSTMSPTTGLHLPCKDLVPLPSLQEALDEFLKARLEVKEVHAKHASAEQALHEKLHQTQDHLIECQGQVADLSALLAARDCEIDNLRRRLHVSENVIAALRSRRHQFDPDSMPEKEPQTREAPPPPPPGEPPLHSLIGPQAAPPLPDGMHVAENVITAMSGKTQQLEPHDLPKVQHSEATNLPTQQLSRSVVEQNVQSFCLPQLGAAKQSFVSRLVPTLVEGEQYGFDWVPLWARQGNLQAIVNTLGPCVAQGTSFTQHAFAKKALRAAAGNGHAGVVRYLLELRASLEVPSADEDTSDEDTLHKSDNSQHVPSADEDTSDETLNKSYKTSALSRAAWSGHLSVVRLLLASGAAQRQISSAIQAASAGKHHLVQRCLEAHSRLLQRETSKMIGVPCQTFLQAAKAGNLQRVIEGFSVSDRIQIHDLQEALYEAARHGQISVIRLLFQQFAFTPSVLGSSDTPLLAAAISGNLEMIHYLLESEHPLDPEALVAASKRGFIDIVSLLLFSKCPINSLSNVDCLGTGCAGCTALMASAMMGRTDVTKLLLLRRASPGVSLATGETAISLALHNGFIENARLVAECMTSNDWDSFKVSIPDPFPLPRRVAVSRLPVLRFSVGARTCCKCYPCRQLGTVVRQWYSEGLEVGYPIGQDGIVPYQVRLDSGVLIYVPEDKDDLIHDVEDFHCQSEAIPMATTVYIRIVSIHPEQAMCTGAYRQIHGTAHGTVWKHEEVERYLYYVANCYCIGNGNWDGSDMPNQIDHVYFRSIPTCSMCPPNLRVGPWLRFDGKQKGWIRDCDIVVSTCASLLPEVWKDFVNATQHFSSLADCLRGHLFERSFSDYLAIKWLEQKDMLVRMLNEDFVLRPYDAILEDLRVLLPGHDALSHSLTPMWNRGRLREFFRSYSSRLLATNINYNDIATYLQERSDVDHLTQQQSQAVTTNLVRTREAVVYEAAPKSPAVPPLLQGWEEHKDEEGNSYFYYPATGRTQWDRPTKETPTEVVEVLKNTRRRW